MARTDFYRAVHEGTRALLLEARQAARLARSAGGDELARAASTLRRVDGLLRAGAERHDEHVLPHLARLAPVLAAELETRYDRCEGLGAALSRLLDRIAQAPPIERAALA